VSGSLVDVDLKGARMTFLRSERLAALLLLAAAVIGVVLANTPAHDAVEGVLSTELGPAGTPWHLAVDEWIKDGLLALFFLIAAIELRHEFSRGELRSPARAVRPAIAALGGVIVPIGIYLALTAGTGQDHGWPIPTATDVAFALGVLAVFGRGFLPSRVRAFLLALAIIDDLIGIVFIAVVFAHDIELLPLGIAIAAVAAFGGLALVIARGIRRDGREIRPGDTQTVSNPTTGVHPALAGIIIAVMVLLGIIAWAATLAGGIHPTIAAVALGLMLPEGPAHRVRSALEPAVNGVVLPIFALTASFVVIPHISEGIQPVFWAIAIALPFGKLIGIAGAGWLADRLFTKQRRRRLRVMELLSLGGLGGIGFTVSLLLAALAFARSPELDAQATLAVLGGSIIAIVLSGVFLTIEVAGYRGLAKLRAQALEARDSGA